MPAGYGYLQMRRGVELRVTATVRVHKEVQMDQLRLLVVIKIFQEP